MFGKYKFAVNTEYCWKLWSILFFPMCGILPLVLVQGAASNSNTYVFIEFLLPACFDTERREDLVSLLHSPVCKQPARGSRI